ncbi:hypothetical protein FIBSPDRAFT_170372 [Athelia psychrophila]|uniref:Uncharacterized protein n=1 Tax=Athelia psychrophila TaxID=1759441 RepID=A0A166AWV3_9AGAM|nr:hypothetical protein FIBSPDRAFT_170372 [Fibularhizoctonia sp. CBS 109695]
MVSRMPDAFVLLCNPSSDLYIQLLERTTLYHSIFLLQQAQNHDEFRRQRACQSKRIEWIRGDRLRLHRGDISLHPRLPFLSPFLPVFFWSCCGGVVDVTGGLAGVLIAYSRYREGFCLGIVVQIRRYK